MQPLLQRVLVVDPQPTSARFVAGLMRDVCRPETWIAESNAQAMELAAEHDPQIVFAELSDQKVDGVALTRALRRSDLSCRKAPVILVTSQATAGAILAARDAGVHEFLRKPFTVKDLMRRLEAVTLRGRDWVEAVDYVGPDRRRFNSAEFKGPLKRQVDVHGPTDGARIGQCLKILRSALGAIDRDPAQALRAMLAQTTELQLISGGGADSRLTMVVGDFHRYLFEASSLSQRLDRSEAERKAAPLLAYLPSPDQRAA
ncbi:response regulator [Phenylobacterium deserti]|uniref:Response regulator n=2 Tax=Phenylobacterium deserti TaxID=1914756 RepID=A0A328AVT3_9CAUL|nr:response regulator [Phenylobacterium deserti]